MPENEMMETGADGIAGKLQVRLVEEGTRRPVAGADIQITYEGSPDSPVKSTVTDESGMTGIMDLPAPDPSYSENYSEQQPYSEYTVRVLAPGYEDVEVAGTEVLPECDSDSGNPDAESQTAGRILANCHRPTYTFRQLSTQDRGTGDQAGDGDRGDCLKPGSYSGICHRS